MTAQDQRIIDALKQAGIDYDVEGFDPSKSFTDNGIDSLDVMSLFLAIEEKHGVTFSEEEANSIKSPLGITQALEGKLR